MTKTFECGNCGEETPMEEHGLDGVCDKCFDEDYPDLICYNDINGTSKTCFYHASDRGNLEQHWEEDANHTEEHND